MMRGRETTMTIKERMDLGLHLARAQTMVMRAFSHGFDPNCTEQIDSFVMSFTATLTQARRSHRFQIVEGTELCIDLLRDRSRQQATNEMEVERSARTERALSIAIQRAIDRLVEIDFQARYRTTEANAHG
jgi:hypothetical protein